MIKWISTHVPALTRSAMVYLVPTIAQKVARVGQHRGRDGEIRHGVQSGAGFKNMGNHVHRKRDGRYAAWYFRASG
jgi:hypothetical protein